MERDEKKPEPAQDAAGVKKPETSPDQERGERIDTGKAIAQGGKSGGHVPGADPDASRH
jgi:hypothetical protein